MRMKEIIANQRSAWLLTFNSHKWPRQNISLQYQYNIEQTSDENKEKYQFDDC